MRVRVTYVALNIGVGGGGVWVEEAKGGMSDMMSAVLFFLGLAGWDVRSSNVASGTSAYFKVHR